MSCAQACDAMIKGSSQGQCFESCKNDNSTCEISIDLSSGQVEKYDVCGSCEDGGKIKDTSGCEFACNRAVPSDYYVGKFYTSEVCTQCLPFTHSKDGKECEECTGPGFAYQLYEQFGQKECVSCSLLIRPLNGCCSFSWLDIFFFLFMIPWTVIPLAMLTMMFSTMYTFARFSRDADTCFGKVCSRRSWSEQRRKGGTCWHYELTVKYPSETERVGTSPALVQKPFLTSESFYNECKNGVETEVLRMPLPFDPRRAVLKHDHGFSSLPWTGEDCRFNSLYGGIFLILRTICFVLAGSFFLFFQALVVFALAFGMVAVNVYMPYCYSNLIVWPPTFVGILILIQRLFIDWGENDLEGTIIENDPLLDKQGKLKKSKSKKKFVKHKPGATKMKKALGRTRRGSGSKTSSIVSIMTDSMRDLAEETSSSLRSITSSGGRKDGFTEINGRGLLGGSLRGATFADVETGISLGQISLGIGGHGDLRGEDITGWGKVEFGHICCGPGILYLYDDTITVLDENITNEAEGRAKVAQMNGSLKYKSGNPIVLWQIASPWSSGVKEGESSLNGNGDEQSHYFVGLRKKFFSQVGVNPREPRAYARQVMEYQSGMKWGSSLFYAEGY